MNYDYIQFKMFIPRHKEGETCPKDIGCLTVIMKYK